MSASTQTPKDMVFSQTSLKAHTILKVVELDRLKAEKKQQVNGLNGVITDGNTQASLVSPAPTTSFSEVYLKSEAEEQFESKMFHETDCEFFQDLDQWCSDHAREEQVQTIDSPKKTEETPNTDTLHTPFPPQGWEVIDANSSVHSGFCNTTLYDPLSPNVEGFMQLDNKLLYPDLESDRKMPRQDQIWDIPSLPVVLDLASEQMVDLNPCNVTDTVGYYNTPVTDYIEPTNTHKMLLIDQEDSLDMPFQSVTQNEVENNLVVTEYDVISNDQGKRVLEQTWVQGRGAGLSLDIPAPLPWSNASISTPDVVSFVEQLETEKYTPPAVKTSPSMWPLHETEYISADKCSNTTVTSVDYEPTVTSVDYEPTVTSVDYEPITPKTESHIDSDLEDAKSHTSRRRRHNSEDSDETYTPDAEHTPKKQYKRRKPSIPIKDMILALEEAQPATKARRGRPPKRRVSVVSSACSIDESMSPASTHDSKYRDLRNKNNEASKLSRMKRKLKELQMEQLADELDDSNAKLRVRAEILQDMVTRLKDALMTAILQKK